MKTLQFKLKSAVSLIPLSENTDILLLASRDIIVSDAEPATTAHRQPSFVLAVNNRGRLTRSPKGRNTTRNITLPTKKASMAEFIEQIQDLFNIAYLEGTMDL